jgi:hypothetical protein
MSLMFAPPVLPAEPVAKPLCILPFGACLMHGPLNPEARAGARMTYPAFGRIPGVYTFAEMMQMIDVVSGRRTVPEALAGLCNIEGPFHPAAEGPGFAGVDVALVEPASPIDLTLDGWALNRAALGRLINPLHELGRDASRALNHWFRIGLMEVDEVTRAEAVQELLPLVPPDWLDAELIGTVLRNTRSTRADVPAALQRLKAELRLPIGVVNYVFHYMPDGRAVSWPSGWHEEIAAVSAELDMPLFEPAELVTAHGVEAALRADLRHYRDDFLPVVADALIDFAGEVRDRADRRAGRRIF